jgi:hypothetical protein
VAAAGIIALLGLATVVASLGYLHLAPTGLSPIRNAVSQYGITSFRAGYRVATLAFAVAGVSLAVGVDGATGSRGHAVVVALVVFALARAAISWFPMDSPGAQLTSTGRTHGLLAIAAFGAVTIAAFRLGGVLSDQTRWHNLSAVSTACGVAMAASLLGVVLARSYPALRARFGAIERGFYLSAIAWFAVFAVAATVKPG